MLRWTDAHNHLQDPRLGDPGPVIAAMKSAGVTRCVVNATREADWPAVENLATTTRISSHPRSASIPGRRTPRPAAGRSGSKLVGKITRKPPSASAGSTNGFPIRRWKSSVRCSSTNSASPAKWTGRSPSIASRRGARLFDAFAEAPPPSRFLMHSFGGSIEMARRLIPLGAFFSFSGHFLHPRKSAVLEVFRQLPHDRILLETDAPDMLPPAEIITHPLPENHNHPANLPAIGHALAAALGMPPEDLAELTRDNARRCFANRPDPQTTAPVRA